MLHDYRAVAFRAQNVNSRKAILAHLDEVLPSLWESDYASMTRSPSHLLEIPFGDATRDGHFVKYLFDQTSGHPSLAGRSSAELRGHTDDRVVAVWGTSRVEPAGTRDSGRMKGFLEGVWGTSYAGLDRGHFFAHTMGGGLDINLFPQVSRINRGGLWRELERYCASHPGTFCFVHPIYTDKSWRPTQLEYGVFLMPPASPLEFRGHLFDN